ncbi:MAG: Fic family protein, partial [Bacteroidetes bacterium]|nr:Fic family protein [Bacteroidota bacterium]
MKTLGEKIKILRTAKTLTLKDVSSKLKIDVALISKIERNERKPTREQVSKFAKHYKANEKELLLLFLAEKVIYEIGDHSLVMDVLRVAEEQLKYGKGLSKTVDAIISEIDKIKSKLDKFRPFPKEQLKNLEQYFKVEYTFESNRIEGNTLTLQETALVVEKGMTVSGKSMREHLEAINHAEAVDFIMEVVKSKEPLTERLVKDIHAIVLQGIDKENAGAYRKVDVRISGSKHLPPSHYRLPELMEAYIFFYKKNRKKIHPVLLAADMHEKLVAVHPFVDGNGRTSRLVMNLILLQNGYPIANISGEQINRLAYYNALEQVQVDK